MIVSMLSIDRCNTHTTGSTLEPLAGRGLAQGYRARRTDRAGSTVARI
jgi:hypothetical protein